MLGFQDPGCWNGVSLRYFFALSPLLNKLICFYLGFSLWARALKRLRARNFLQKRLCCYENIASSDIILFLTTTSLLGICSELWMPDVGFYSTQMLDVAANAGEVKGKLVYVYSTVIYSCVLCILQLHTTFDRSIRSCNE